MKHKCCGILIYFLLPSSTLVKLFNQGIDKIEVSDDGCGIPTHSRPLVVSYIITHAPFLWQYHTMILI